MIGIADAVRPTSAAAVAELRSLGVEVVMLTGDNAATATRIAAQLGVTTVIADVLPGDKAAKVQELAAAGLETITVVLLLTDTMTYAAVLVLPLLIQMGGVMYNPCSRAAVVHVVDPEDRVAANAVMSLIENVTAIVAPLAASSVLLFGDMLWVFFLIDALTFVLGALLLGRRPRGAELLVAEHIPADAHRRR